MIDLKFARGSLELSRPEAVRACSCSGQDEHSARWRFLERTWVVVRNG